MGRQFSRTLKVVIIVHAVLLLLVFSRSGIARLFEPEPELIIPVEFVVDVSPAISDISDVMPDIPEFEPEPIPEPNTIPEPQAVSESKPEPKPKPFKRKKIKISHTPVNRSNSSKQKCLSEAEIKKLLDKGALAGDHTSIPDEDARCMDIIKRTLTAVWDQPSSEVAGDSIAVLQLKFSTDSRISSGKLYRKSGNAALDSSVARITENIQKINGLTPDFIRRHPSVTISFSVD